MSNFWENEVAIDEKGKIRIYESGEHCFHGEKYFRLGELCEDKNRKSVLINYGKMFLKPSQYKTCACAKKMGGKNGLLLSSEELKLRSSISVDVQREICDWKFDHYEEVRNDLIESGTKILVHPALRCSEDKLKDRLWEGKAIVVNGKVEILGRNLLGKIWMEYRSVMERRLYLKNKWDNFDLRLGY